VYSQQLYPVDKNILLTRDLTSQGQRGITTRLYAHGYSRGPPSRYVQEVEQGFGLSEWSSRGQRPWDFSCHHLLRRMHLWKAYVPSALNGSNSQNVYQFSDGINLVFWTLHQAFFQTRNRSQKFFKDTVFSPLPAKTLASASLLINVVKTRPTLQWNSPPEHQPIRPFARAHW